MAEALYGHDLRWSQFTELPVDRDHDVRARRPNGEVAGGFFLVGLIRDGSIFRDGLVPGRSEGRRVENSMVHVSTDESRYLSIGGEEVPMWQTQRTGSAETSSGV